MIMKIRVFAVVATLLMVASVVGAHAPKFEYNYLSGGRWSVPMQARVYFLM